VLPIAPVAPALPVPAPRSGAAVRRSLGILGIVFGLAAAAAAGAAAADDGDVVADLEGEVVELQLAVDLGTEQVAKAEQQLQRADAVTEVVRAELDSCREAVEGADDLLTEVNQLTDAWRTFMVTPIGSPEEAEAVAAMDQILLGLPAAAGAAEQAVARCRPAVT
jgi:hypothetical protein